MVAKNASLQRTTAAVRGAGVPAWPSAHFLLREYAAQKTSHSRGTLCDTPKKDRPQIRRVFAGEKNEYSTILF